MTDPTAASDTAVQGFAELGLPAPLLQALAGIGYESPSPIQAQTIPPLLAGRDLLGQAQTGTGKTAAFALPILARLDFDRAAPQALVLAPTRELAIQVAEAFQKYAAQLPRFQVVPIYGGQSYTPQLKALKRGAQVVVGTPGRIADHIRRGSLALDGLRHLVLDEADEMLRMGFLEEVEWILQQMPASRQTALFSATMPPPIRRVARTHLHEPAEVTIAARTTTGANIRQRYWLVSGLHKLDALTRFLETEDFDGMIVFARTKAMTTELAEKLEARGFAARALNGDMPQAERERTVARFRDGHIDILCATDIAARGLDLERISHVLNYDIPTDPESYVHRIGRTGRAGRSGEAILFVAPRERHLLRQIERATRQPIEAIAAPSPDAVNQRRIERFKQSLAEALTALGDDEKARRGHEQMRAILAQFATESGAEPLDIAAVLAGLLHRERPLLLDGAAAQAVPAEKRPSAPAAAGTGAAPPAPPPAKPRPSRAAPQRPEVPMESFRIEVGARHGVKPDNIVGAIAGEAGLDSQFIGRVEIFDTHSLVELPAGMPKAVYKDLRKTWVCGQQLQISRLVQAEGGARRRR